MDDLDLPSGEHTDSELENDGEMGQLQGALMKVAADVEPEAYSLETGPDTDDDQTPTTVFMCGDRSSTSTKVVGHGFGTSEWAARRDCIKTIRTQYKSDFVCDSTNCSVGGRCNKIANFAQPKVTFKESYELDGETYWLITCESEGASIGCTQCSGSKKTPALIQAPVSLKAKSK